MAPAPAPVDSHGSPAAPMPELRFAIITTAILILSYATALTVSSLDRVLAYVGSTGSTSISFILPGLFYYKISDPNGIHHQRLTKEDDDANVEDDSEEDGLEPAGASLVDSVISVQSGVSGVLPRPHWKWRRRWRWDLEHLETGLLRKLALCLSIYGICIMLVCLTMNLFVNAAEAHEVVL
jgi:amino acid permease